MNFVDKDGATKVYIPVHPCLTRCDGNPIISENCIAIASEKLPLQPQLMNANILVLLKAMQDHFQLMLTIT